MNVEWVISCGAFAGPILGRCLMSILRIPIRPRVIILLLARLGDAINRWILVNNGGIT